MAARGNSHRLNYSGGERGTKDFGTFFPRDTIPQFEVLGIN